MQWEQVLVLFSLADLLFVSSRPPSVTKFGRCLRWSGEGVLAQIEGNGRSLLLEFWNRSVFRKIGWVGIAYSNSNFFFFLFLSLSFPLSHDRKPSRNPDSGATALKEPP